MASDVQGSASLLWLINLQFAHVQSLGCPSWSGLQVLHLASSMVPIVKGRQKGTLPSRVFVGCTALLACHHNSSSLQELLELVRQVVPYHMRHNAEPEAVDMLLEVERLDWLAEHVDDKNYSRSVAVAVMCGGYRQCSPALPGRLCIGPMTGRIAGQSLALLCLQAPASDIHLKGVCLAIWWTKWSTASQPGSCNPAAGNCTP